MRETIHWFYDHVIKVSWKFICKLLQGFKFSVWLYMLQCCFNDVGVAEESTRNIILIVYCIYICFVKLQFKPDRKFSNSSNSFKCNEFQGVDVALFYYVFLKMPALRRTHSLNIIFFISVLQTLHDNWLNSFRRVFEGVRKPSQDKICRF